MAEELHRDSLSDRARRDPATLAAWERAAELEDKDVYDVNGRLVGRVTRCFAEGGTLTRCDVTLSENAKGVFGVGDREVAGVPATWIARVKGDRVELDRAGEQLLRPEDPRPLGASDDLRGAPELPRKER